MEKQGKKEEKKFNFGKFKLIIILCVLVYVGITFANQQSTMATQLRKHQELAEKKEALQREFDFLRAELSDYIGTDEYFEQQARMRLGWVKDGELKYVEGEQTQQPDVGGEADGQQASAEPTE